MESDDLKKYTFEGFKDSFNSIQEKENEDFFEQTLQNNDYRIDALYEFGEGKVDGKSGVSINYTAVGKGDLELRENVSIFTGYIEYDIKGAIDELAKVDVPVIDYLFSSKDSEKIGILESVFYNPFVKPEIIQGWKIIIGPQKKMIGDNIEFVNGNDAQDILQAVYPELNNQLFPKADTYFIKSWITRVGNEGMWADCRVNMENWELGQNLLFDYGDTWNIGTQKVSLKQIILLIPKELDELEKGFEILENLKEQAAQHVKNKREENTPQPKKKAWWQFWK